jgi:hypothetical protein
VSCSPPEREVHGKGREEHRKAARLSFHPSPFTHLWSKTGIPLWDTLRVIIERHYKAYKFLIRL